MVELHAASSSHLAPKVIICGAILLDRQVGLLTLASLLTKLAGMLEADLISSRYFEIKRVHLGPVNWTCRLVTPVRLFLLTSCTLFI